MWAAVCGESMRQELLVLAPDDTCGITTLKREPTRMERLYEKGCRDGEKISAFLAGQSAGGPV